MMGAGLRGRVVGMGWGWGDVIQDSVERGGGGEDGGEIEVETYY